MICLKVFRKILERYKKELLLKNLWLRLRKSAIKKNKQLGRRKDKIVRITKLSEKPTQGQYSLEKYKRAQKLFQKLREEYGIAIPHISLVAVIDKENNKEGKMYTVVDRIYGDNLNEIKRIPLKALPKMDIFF